MRIEGGDGGGEEDSEGERKGKPLQETLCL